MVDQVRILYSDEIMSQWSNGTGFGAQDSGRDEHYTLNTKH